MTKNNFYPISGLLVFIIPFLGIPGIWRNYILSLIGLSIFLYSVWPNISKQLTSKPKLSSKIPNKVIGGVKVVDGK